MKHSIPSVIGFALLSATVYAQDDWSFDGYVATTVLTEYKALHPQIYYHAKVEAQYKVSKSTEAQVQIKGQSNEGERIQFREANIRLKLTREDKIKVGNMKKPVGEEEMYSEEDLPTIDRTFLYNYLGPMNHVGRDIGVQFIHESEEGGLDYNVGAYYNNSSTFAAAARVSSDEAVLPVGIAVSSVFQRLKLDKNVPISTVLGNLSLFQHAERFSWNAEGFVGIDPFASRFRQLAAGSNDEKVWLAGGKASGSYYFSIGDDHQGIEPVIVFGYLAPDTRDFKVYTLEALLGVNCYLNKDTRARVNVHPLLSKNGIDKEFSQVGSTVSLEFQVRW